MLTGATVELAADFGGKNMMVAGGLDPLLGLPPPQLGDGRVLVTPRAVSPLASSPLALSGDATSVGDAVSLKSALRTPMEAPTAWDGVLGEAFPPSPPVVAWAWVDAPALNWALAASLAVGPRSSIPSKDIFYYSANATKAQGNAARDQS